MLRLLWLLLGLFETAPEDEPDEDEPEDDEPEPIRDPEKQALSREAGSWRKKFRAAEARIRELEDGQSGGDSADALRASRLESSFLRVVLARGEKLDVETSWDLLHIRGFADTVTIEDDGDVKGMDEALDKLLDRYPWLADAEPASDPENDRPLRRTAPAPRKRKDGAAEQHSKASLEARFPALRRHAR